MSAVVVARSSSYYSAIHYVLPVLWMTSCLPTISQAHTTILEHILKAAHQVAALRAKSDVCHCHVLLKQAYIVHVHNIRQIWNIVCCLDGLRLGLGQWDSDAELYGVIVISIAFSRLTQTNY